MSSLSSQFITVDLNIGDQLTSISCGHIVVEVIKFVAYQRLQIPYTYQWLKHIINKKKSQTIRDCTESMLSQRYYRIANSALENFDFIVKSLLQEINGPILPDEVCITLGATPVTTKEVYRILLPPFCHSAQCQSNHIATDNKIQRDVFRSLVTSEALNNLFYQPLPPTNMYVFMQKKIIKNQQPMVNMDKFSLAAGCMIPRKSKIVIIDLRKQMKEKMMCCIDFQIFQDTICDNMTDLNIVDDNEDENKDTYEISSTDSLKWFQSSYVMKGFKDCIVNGSSITNTWLSS